MATPSFDITLLTPDERETYEERSAIIEFEAGFSRIEAEYQAFISIIKKRNKTPLDNAL